MRILVLGATGGTGRAVITTAAARGHEVAGLVRSAEALAGTPATEYLGNALDIPSMEAALSSFAPNAVVCALGTRGRESGSLANALGPIVQAVEASSAPRLLMVSSMGVGESMGHYGPVIRTLLPLFLGKALREKEPQEAAVRASTLDYTIVRPCALKNGPLTGYTVITDPTQRVGNAKLSRTTLAAFLVDELENPQHQRTAVSVIGS